MTKRDLDAEGRLYRGFRDGSYSFSTVEELVHI
jgi:hypothetical protein